MEYKPSKYNLVIYSNSLYTLVFNTKTGALIELSDQEFKLFTQGVYNDMLDILLEQGFIVYKSVNEFNNIILNEMCNIFLDNNKHSFVIAPTLKCNMNCYYCFEKKRNTSNSMTEYIQQKVVSYICNKILNNNSKKIFISWFGGEPLLALDTIKKMSHELIEFCGNHTIDFEAMLTTNGYFLTKDKAEICKELKIKKVQITLDGDKEYYCKAKNVSNEIYDQVIKNIFDICEILDITVRLNLSQDNFISLINLINEIKHCRNIKFYIAPIVNYNNILNSNISNTVEECQYVKMKHELQNLISFEQTSNTLECSCKPLSIGCGLMKILNNAIGPSGELYYCEHDLGIEEKIIGDVFHGLYYNEYFMKSITPSHYGECKECKIFPLCLSGCQAEVKEFKNNVNYCDNKILSLKKYLIKQYAKEVNNNENNNQY